MIPRQNVLDAKPVRTVQNPVLRVSCSIAAYRSHVAVEDCATFLANDLFNLECICRVENGWQCESVG